AEETWIQDPIDRLAIELMGVYNKEKVIVYNTYQLYRSDRLSFLKISHKIAAEGNFILGAKLVRGAYMEKERARASAQGYQDPIQPNKEATDFGTSGTLKATPKYEIEIEVLTDASEPKAEAISSRVPF
ncbi:MAG: hypothetical protein EBW56_03130, partial [Burkholderiaceae bacterium]|nr:hypothetical protein [Burkholderiaceae bacterium]